MDVIWLLAAGIPLALVVGFLLGRWTAAQYLHAAQAVQAITDAAGQRMLDEANRIAKTDELLEKNAKLIQTQGRLIGGVQQAMNNLTLELSQNRTLMGDALRHPVSDPFLQVGEDPDTVRSHNAALARGRDIPT